MSKLPIKKIIISFLIFLAALITLFFIMAATFVVKYGTPAEHGDSYRE